jgi:DnaJ like chaperone protein
MRIIGKLIGAVIGLIVFRNPFGLLIGAMVGHFYDVVLTQLRPPSMGSGFIEPLFAFAGALSKSDGRVSEVEIAAAESLMARLRLEGAQRRAAIERFNAGKQADFPVQLAINDLKRWCNARRDLAFLVLDLLLDLVYAEGALAVPKLALLRQLCWALGVNDHELAALSAMKGYAPAGPGAQRGAHAGVRPPPPGPHRADPYLVLGLERSANEREIKRAYRKLMSRHHPDKLGDVPDELKRRAEERAREINAAYERVKAERGFK